MENKINMDVSKNGDQSISTILKIVNQRNYLGDVKWVLYQYICDMNADEGVIIRCGKYAYDKIRKIGEKDYKEENLNDIVTVRQLNGESVTAWLMPSLDKKQIIISKNKYPSELYSSYIAEEVNTTIYPDDIVLYFA